MPTARSKSSSRRVATIVTVATIALVACSSSGTHSVIKHGGTATWAELGAPNFIFPFMGAAQASVANQQLFQSLMYRPMYFFGTANRPDLNTQLSIAEPPVYSANRTSASITLKPYRWSNGERVTPDDVMFWMNMLHSEKRNFIDYSSGTMPDDVKQVVIDGSDRLTFVFDRGYNTSWMTDNQLSQIVPMPRAWDVTAERAAPGTGGCFGKPYGTADAACSRVFTVLSKESGYDPANPSKPAKSPTTFAKNPLWQVADGPWRLQSLDTDGNATFVPNPAYSGPVKPRLARFKEVAFTGDIPEYNALRAGTLDVGYLPSADAPATREPTAPPAANAGLGGYHLDPLYAWAFGYLPYNFNSTGDAGNAGAIFTQLYVRQAFQDLVDQQLYIDRIYRGWGTPLAGPVPPLPRSSYLPASVDQTTPYPYDVARARALLGAHGWRVTPGGVSTCVRPGSAPSECGANVPTGARLDFTLEYPTGEPSEQLLLEAETSSWEQAGIHVALRPVSDAAFGRDVESCTTGPHCSWEMSDEAWLYSPDFYPSGEVLFATGAGYNVGSYHDVTNDGNIRGSYLGTGSIADYDSYLAQQLPVVFEPKRVGVFTEVRNGLHGVTPQNPLLSITPENWYFAR
jgi:peptide/nickel transport system substrate-binding protein